MLKRYQERVVKEVGIFLDRLAIHQATLNAKYASNEAWEEAQKEFNISSSYNGHRNGLGKDLPDFCIRVPTGGGKTLLATQTLGLIYKTILKDRNGTGLVLWVVPSDQIYKDTLRRLRNRSDFYRESLEFAVSRRIEIWEKDEVFRITPEQMRSNLNILLLKLASTNRESREQLKFFRDSGGNIVQHFPAEDDFEKHKELKNRIPNLDITEEDPRGEFLVKTSLGNLVRLYEPPVILDEGHKATSQLARQTIEGFNASVVVELSATPPKGANILSRVTGKELLDEEMIKLPMNISNSNEKSWKDCLTQAKSKRGELASLAVEHYRKSEKVIRPIVLVQVERTGKDQRDPRYVHSEDVKEHLIQRLGIAESAIAIKSSEKDDIEGIDLLADGCAIEWIITKAALQEGWDCPFAYILVSLNNTGSLTSMTQLVGRILRQPYIERSPVQELNESYVFCMKRKASDIAYEVKKSLEKEGYEGDWVSKVDVGDGISKGPDSRETQMREIYRRFYKDFQGKVYLPRFAVKEGRQYKALDYHSHLISAVDVAQFNYEEVDWNLASELEKAKDRLYRITLEQDVLLPVEEREVSISETDEQVKGWLVASLAIDHFSFKQLKLIVERMVSRLYKINSDLHDKLSLVKFILREKITGFIERETDRITRQTFEQLFNDSKLRFFLECKEARFEIPPKVEIRAKQKRMTRDDGDQVQRSLFDYVPDDLNEYEKAVALYLDSSPQVLWWYRNLVGPEQFSIQGYRRPRIYPDFVVQQGKNKKPTGSVLVVETKGKQLKGSEDTNYKRDVAQYFSKVGRKVPWQRLADDFRDNTFRVQVLDEGEYADRDWKDELRRLLETSD